MTVRISNVQKVFRYLIFIISKLHNEELTDLYSLPNIVRVVKSRRMRWAGRVARMGEGRGVHSVLVGKPEGKSHWGDQDVDGRIILRWIFRKLEGVVGRATIFQNLKMRTLYQSSHYNH